MDYLLDPLALDIAVIYLDLILKAGKLVHECQMNVADRAVTLLAYE